MFLLLDSSTSTDMLEEISVQLRKQEGIDSKPTLPWDCARVDGQYAVHNLNVGAHVGSLRRRWHELSLASQGARLFTDTPELASKESPIYAGAAPKSAADVARIISDLKYAKARADLFQMMGVNYIGRTYADPRHLILLDNKADNKLLSPENSQELHSLYGSLPKDWWGTCGFVSTGNVDKLGTFLDAFSDSIPMGYTSGALAKLKYLGVDYTTIPVPPADIDPSYGLDVREKANRFEYDLNTK